MVGESGKWVMLESGRCWKVEDAGEGNMPKKGEIPERGKRENNNADISRRREMEGSK